MKWYHYTRINCFKKAMADQALLSFYQQFKEQYSHKLDDFEYCMNIFKELDGEDEYQRLNNVFLTSKNTQKKGTKNDVVLGFKTELQPNLEGILAVPKIPFDYLVDVGTKKEYQNLVRKTLNYMHNGLYKNIEIYNII
jgi:hypothetical protein